MAIAIAVHNIPEVLLQFIKHASNVHVKHAIRLQT